MNFLKLLAAVPFFLMSVGLGLLFALVGLWSALGFTFLAMIATIILRATNGGGRDHVYFIAFVPALFLEGLLLVIVTSNNLLGVHGIMDGYAASFSTQALIAFVPVALYVVSLCVWAPKLSHGAPGGPVPRAPPRAPW